MSSAKREGFLHGKDDELFEKGKDLLDCTGQGGGPTGKSYLAAGEGEVPLLYRKGSAGTVYASGTRGGVPSTGGKKKGARHLLRRRLSRRKKKGQIGGGELSLSSWKSFY